MIKLHFGGYDPQLMRWIRPKECGKMTRVGGDSNGGDGCGWRW